MIEFHKPCLTTGRIIWILLCNHPAVRNFIHRIHRSISSRSFFVQLQLLFAVFGVHFFCFLFYLQNYIRLPKHFFFIAVLKLVKPPKEFLLWLEDIFSRQTTHFRDFRALSTTQTVLAPRQIPALVIVIWKYSELIMSHSGTLYFVQKDTLAWWARFRILGVSVSANKKTNTNTTAKNRVS